MNELSRHIGSRIRQFRKMQGFTLQYMADQLNKSKATMSKYETGDIILDVETLYDIANLLQVSISQLTDRRPDGEILPDDGENAEFRGEVSSEETSSPSSPFFRSERLYFYYYDGRYRRIKEGIIRIMKNGTESCPVTVSVSAGTPMGRSSEEHYTGLAVYSDMLIRFDFTNQNQPLEKNQLSIFNPADSLCEGLLSGISTVDQVPFACKCLISLTPQDTSLTGGLMPHLAFTRRELQRLQKLNMMLADGNQL